MFFWCVFNVESRSSFLSKKNAKIMICICSPLPLNSGYWEPTFLLGRPIFRKLTKNEFKKVDSWKLQSRTEGFHGFHLQYC